MVLIAFSILQKVCAVCLDFSHKGSRVKMCRASVWGQGVGRPHPHHRVERVYSHHACPPLARESLHHSSPTRASEREAADCTAPQPHRTHPKRYPTLIPFDPPSTTAWRPSAPAPPPPPPQSPARSPYAGAASPPHPAGSCRSPTSRLSTFSVPLLPVMCKSTRGDAWSLVVPAFIDRWCSWRMMIMMMMTWYFIFRGGALHTGVIDLR